MKPVKRRGNRRYYQHHEVLLVRRIRELLYQEGFTINGARHRLEEGNGRAARAAAAPAQELPAEMPAAAMSLRAEMASIIEYLRI